MFDQLRQSFLKIWENRGKIAKWDPDERVFRLHKSIFWVADTLGLVSLNLVLIGANPPLISFLFLGFFVSRMVRALCGESDLGGLTFVFTKRAP